MSTHFNSSDPTGAQRSYPARYHQILGNIPEIDPPRTDYYTRPDKFSISEFILSKLIFLQVEDLNRTARLHFSVNGAKGANFIQNGLP